MKTPEQIAEEVAAQHFSTYEDSAEEVDHPEGQPIVETWPALRECIVAAIRADRAQAVVPGGPEQIAAAMMPEDCTGFDSLDDAITRGNLDPSELRSILALAVTEGINAAWESWEPETTAASWENEDGITFQPFINGRAVGFWATDDEGRRECVRLEASTSHNYNVTYVNLFEGTGPKEDEL